MLASHNRAAQVDGGDAVESSFGDLVEWRISADDTYADIIVKNVDSPPTPLCSLDHCRECHLLGNISLEGDAFSAPLSRHRGCFLGGGKIVVDCHHLGALLGEAQSRGATIAQSLAWRLACADDEGDLVLQAHVDLGRKQFGSLCRHYGCRRRWKSP